VCYQSSNQLLTLLEKRAIHGEKLVVLRESEWKQILVAYDSPLLHKIVEEVVIFHPVKDVRTKEISWCVENAYEEL